MAHPMFGEFAFVLASLLVAALAGLLIVLYLHRFVTGGAPAPRPRVEPPTPPQWRYPVPPQRTYPPFTPGRPR